MDAQATVQIRTESTKTLDAAYETLCSMRGVSRIDSEFNRINKMLLFAHITGKFRPSASVSAKHSCLITIKPIDNFSCELTIVASRRGDTGTDSDDNMALISDFLEKLSHNI